MPQKNPSKNPPESATTGTPAPDAGQVYPADPGSPQRLSEAVLRDWNAAPFCGRCSGPIVLELDGDPPYWRHLDLAAHAEPHLAYRDELIPPAGPPATRSVTAAEAHGNHENLLHDVDCAEAEGEQGSD